MSFAGKVYELNLPQEIQECILLYLSKPEDLLRACSTCTQYRDICSSSIFWRKRFERQGLDLLREGYTLAAWLAIYKKAFQAAQVARRLISSGKEVEIKLEEIFDLRHLGFVITRQIRELWQQTREGYNSQEITMMNVSSGYLETLALINDNYYLVFTPDPLYSMKIFSLSKMFTEEGGLDLEIHEIASSWHLQLTEKDMFNVIYRVAFYGYSF
jgi:hypothetical protein